MADCTNLGKKIRAVRSQKKITQERLGELIDVGTTHISHIETGNTMPSMRTFVKIINALECSADELLKEE
ncbi:MAG: helix-turn-helix transcriptional regulator [Clostridiales bacterium]|nr:helix-turn-helix transcriptional regulator [Clostridiales bacterium]